MKHNFKKWLTIHKGKPLTLEMIENIASKYEEEIGDLLYNEGLCLESLCTGKKIFYGETNQADKDWAVQNMWKTEREFKTLKGAIKFANERD